MKLHSFHFIYLISDLKPLVLVHLIQLFLDSGMMAEVHNVALQSTMVVESTVFPIKKHIPYSLFFLIQMISL